MQQIRFIRFQNMVYTIFVNEQTDGRTDGRADGRVENTISLNWRRRKILTCNNANISEVDAHKRITPEISSTVAC